MGFLARTFRSLVLAAAVGAAVAGAEAARRFLLLPPPAGGLQRTAAFGALRERFSGAFGGGSLRALFGAIDLDLQGATLPDNGAEVRAVAMFGAVRVRVPRTWRVHAEGVSFFGGVRGDGPPRVEGGGAGEAGTGPPLLRVRGLGLFGGVRVDTEPRETRPEPQGQRRPLPAAGEMAGRDGGDVGDSGADGRSAVPPIGGAGAPR